MTLQVNLTYEPFCSEPEYVQANEAFMRLVDLSGASQLLDLACGTGLMSELALRARPELRVIGLDLSLDCLRLTRDRLAGLGRASGLACCVSPWLPVVSGHFDAVLIGNAIHMLGEPGVLLRELRRLLRRRGVLAFNTSFYARTFAPGTESFYHDWLKLALRYVQDKSRRLRELGERGIPRKRGSARAAFAQRWLSESEWVRVLEDAGFEPIHSGCRSVELTVRSFQAIGAYGGFAGTLLSGYPVEEASEALQATAAAAMAGTGRDSIERYWLEVVARRL